MKKIFRTTLTTAIIAAVGVNMYHTYDSYRNVNMSESEFLFKENVEALSSIELDDEDIDEATRLRRQRCFDDNGIWGSSIRCMGNMQVTFVTGTGNYSVEGTVAGTGAKITIPRNYKTKVGKKYDDDFVVLYKCESDPAGTKTEDKNCCSKDEQGIFYQGKKIG